MFTTRQLQIVIAISIKLCFCFAAFSQPVISSVTPLTGAPGSVVSISGTNFSTTAAGNTVYFGGVKATVTAAANNLLTVIVPGGAAQQSISVTVNGLTAYSQQQFNQTFEPDPNLNSLFWERSDIQSALYGREIAAADLDGDGKPDLFVPSNANVPESHIAIHRNTSTTGAISFAPKETLRISDFGIGINYGDFDGDGKLDIVSSSIGTNGDVQVFRNTSSLGAISFSSPSLFPAGVDPMNVIVSDIDLDGKPDLVICNQTLGHTISILRNLSTPGNISFAPRIVLTTELMPYNVVAGDLDGDGKPELVCSNAYSHNLSVFRNTSVAGNLSFQPAVKLSTGYRPQGIAIGDLDKDGKAEIAVVNNQEQTVSVFKNNSQTGGLSFASRVNFTYSFLSGGRGLKIGDVTGDGAPDIIVTGSNSNVSILKNTSTSTGIGFAASIGIYTSSPYAPTITDFDGDGKADIAVSNSAHGYITVFRNKSHEPILTQITPAQGSPGTNITISGYNFLGTTAVKLGGEPVASFVAPTSSTINAIVGNGSSGLVSVDNSAGTTSGLNFTYNAPPLISSFSPVDAGAGIPVVITGSGFTQVSAVRFGDVPAASYTVVSPTTINAIVSNGATGNVSVVTTYGNTSLSGFTWYPRPEITSFSPSAGPVGSIIQINGSNFLDVKAVTIGGVAVTSYTVNSSTSITAIAGSSSSGNISVTTPGGNVVSATVFSFPIHSVTSLSTYSAKAGVEITINGTGFPVEPGSSIVHFGPAIAEVREATPTALKVIVPAGATYDLVTVTANRYVVSSSKRFNLLFDSTGISKTSFGTEKVFSGLESVRTIIGADFDSDGKTDIVTANNASFDGVYVYKNISTGNNHTALAEPLKVYENYGYRFKVAVGDVNGDGKPDLITDWGTEIGIHLNTSQDGNISFAPRFTLPGDNMCLGILLRDFDGDGKTDIAAWWSNAGGSSLTLSLYRNTSLGNTVSFANRVTFGVVTNSFNLIGEDIDGDGKIDIACSANKGSGVPSVLIYRNLSTPGVLSFQAPLEFPIDNSSENCTVGDVDGDGKPDVIAGHSEGAKLFSVLRNTSTPGNISFATRKQFPVEGTAVFVGNADGDGTPDLVTSDWRLVVHENASSVGSVYFNTGVEFLVPSVNSFERGHSAVLLDLDGDGRPEMVAGRASSGFVVFRNQVGEKLTAVCETLPTSVTSEISGTQYQWQVNTGNGFVDITPSAVFPEVTKKDLSITATDIALNGAMFRCKVDGSMSVIHNLIVNRLLYPFANINAPDNICTNTGFYVNLTGLVTPVGSSLQLWESKDGGPFNLIRTSASVTSNAQFFIPGEDNLQPGKRSFFVRMTMPANVTCGQSRTTDTVTVNINQISKPVLKANGAQLFVSNPEAGAVYRWEMMPSGNNSWIGLGENISIMAVRTGNYRVRGIRGGCDSLSDPIYFVVTSLPAQPALAAAISIYPNPVKATLYIDSLRIQDQWQMAELFTADGKNVYQSSGIQRMRSFVIPMDGFARGIYFLILRRKEKAPVFMKILKQ